MSHLDISPEHIIEVFIDFPYLGRRVHLGDQITRTWTSHMEGDIEE